MSKSLRLHSARRSGWKTTAARSEPSAGRSTASAEEWTGSRPDLGTTAAGDPYGTSTVVIARRNAHQSLSRGVVVEASVVGRLLGLKLLRVKAHVTLMPAYLDPITYVTPRATAPRADQPTGGGSLNDAVSLLAQASRTMREAKRITF
jgi:hypothetical protein